MTLHFLPPGCGPADAAVPTATQRDSAGVVVVEDPADMPRKAGGWFVDPEPFLSIGSIDGPEGTLLDDVTGADALPDGSVALLNAGSREIRILDHTCTLVSAIGRDGEGRGEFRYLSLGGVPPGDTVVVMDALLRRLSLVHPDPGLVRSARLGPEVAENATAWGLIRVLEEPVPFTRGIFDEHVLNRIASTARDADHERRLRRSMEENSEHLPPAFRAHGVLKVDALHLLWVEEYRIPGETTHVWSVFDREGVRLARVTLPMPMEVLEIGEDYVMGRVEDESGVEYVRLFRLNSGF